MSRSKEEAIAAGVKVADTLHNMKRRKPWHNYHRKGTYMITVVVNERHPILGTLVSVPYGEAQGMVSAKIELTALGIAIRDEEVRKISIIYKMVEVWKVCIMPDHIHMILRVKEDMPEGKHLGSVIAGFKGGCSRVWWKQKPWTDAQGVVTGATTPAASAAGKATTLAASAAGKATTLATSAAGKACPSLFEAGYNDQILLEDNQLDNWKRYLDDNPRRLAIKRMRPDYFITTRYTDIGEWHCQMVGNHFLLDIPQKAAVIVHGAYTDKEYAEHRKQWLACGEAGGILVSAAIASREKEVMREAMNRGYRIILVRENGFPPLYKPAGESFNACSEGRLLQISPWEYHMARRTISREQCLILNRLVDYLTYTNNNSTCGCLQPIRL
jgi:REP element-mobilizing transposase RayT